MKLQETDSNRRLLAYETSGLPLPYPAIFLFPGSKSNIMLALSKKNSQKVTKIRASGAHTRIGGTGGTLKSYSRDTSREEKTGGRAKDVWESHGGAASTLGGALALKRRARVARTERPRRGRSRGSTRYPHSPPPPCGCWRSGAERQTCGGGGGGTPRAGTQSTARKDKPPGAVVPRRGDGAAGESGRGGRKRVARSERSPRSPPPRGARKNYT